MSRANSCNQLFTEDFARWAQRHFVEHLNICQLVNYALSLLKLVCTREPARTDARTKAQRPVVGEFMFKHLLLRFAKRKRFLLEACGSVTWFSDHLRLV